MLQLLLSATLLASAPLQDEAEKLDPALVERTCETLKAAYRNGTPAELAEAIRAGREVVHADVIELIAKGLRSKHREILDAAIGTLRWMPHPEALDALHATYERDKKLREDDELVASLLKAIGQHGSPRSIELLSDDPFGTPGHRAVQARIYGLGNIRHGEALEALVQMMNKGGSRTGRGAGPYMKQFRLALVVLTGTDQGPSRDMWMRWWNDNKKTFTVAPKVPELPKQILAPWYRYWGLPWEDEGRERREDRGRDPGSRRRTDP